MTLEQMIKRQQAIVARAEAEGRELTAEEQAEFDDLTRSIDALRQAKLMEEAAAEKSAPSVDAEQVRAAERERIREIDSMCKHFGMDASEYINSGASVENARAAIMDQLMKDHAPINMRGSVDVVVDENDKFRRAAADGLMMRSGLSVGDPEEGARELRGL